MELERGVGFAFGGDDAAEREDGGAERRARRLFLGGIDAHCGNSRRRKSQTERTIRFRRVRHILVVRGYQQLIVWQRAMELVDAAYAIARLLPRAECHSLAEQIRRAAVSIPANIADGHARVHKREFLQYLAIARASAAELETHLLNYASRGIREVGATPPAAGVERRGEPNYHGDASAPRGRAFG